MVEHYFHPFFSLILSLYSVYKWANYDDRDTKDSSDFIVSPATISNQISLFIT